MLHLVSDIGHLIESQNQANPRYLRGLLHINQQDWLCCQETAICLLITVQIGTWTNVGTFIVGGLTWP